VGAARFRLGAFFALALISLLVGAMPAGAVSANLVISQVYGGGGNAGAQFTNDYIEIFNRGTSAVDLTGLSVQYASATGSTWQKTDLSGQLSPGQHYLVQEAAGTNPAVSLPTPDASGNIPMSATSGKVALLANQTLLTCGATPNDCLANAALIDFAGYGTANNFEGSGAAPTLSNTTAALRSDQGCNDTDNNAADFSAGTPVPRNTASPTHSCVAEEAPAVTSTSPTDGATNVPVNSDITVNFSEPVNAAPDWYGIFCGTSLAHTAVVTGGPQSFTINPDTDFVPSETCTVTIKADHVSDQDTNDPPDNMTSNVNVTFATTANPDTPIGVVISQVYGGGGNAGAPFSNDFIELFNRSSAAVSLNGASVQYASATGTNWLVTALTNVTLQPKQYYLVQEAAGTSGGAALPAPDATGTTNMSATAGKVALVGGTTPLASCTGSAVADLVGYGSTASCFEGAGPAPAPSNTTAAMRNANGCTDTNNNASDFAASPPLPRNTASPLGNCDDQPPAVSATTPTSGATDVPLTSNITIQFSEAVNVADGWYSISCGTSGAHTAAVSGGPQNFTLNPDSDFATGETCTVTVVAANVTDQDTADPPDAMSGNYVWSFTTEAPLPPPVAIHEIQGAGHTSPRAGQAVANVNGFVTAKRSNGYYMQDPNPDADDATSEGIFVFTNSAPSVNVGDAVRVSGTVAEFRPGGASTTNLTTTEITAPTTSVLTTGNPLPPATVIGSGGRVPPSEVIENDASGSVETTGVFDPASDGIDFYETLEGMLLQVNNAVVVGPTNSRGEMFVLADDGAGAAARTARGGIVIRDLGPEPSGDYASGDFNPERIQLDDAAGVATPNANVGDHFMSPVVGVLDYDFGNFEIEVTSALARVPDGVTREVTAEPGANELSVATFNVENLDALEPQSKFDALAVEIVTNMRSPDVISLEEIQDNNGATNDSVVDADQTLNKLAAAIAAAGGPTYDWRQINPVDDQDGGEPGGNIRVGFMFRTDRGLAFVDRPGGGSTNATSVVDGSSGPELSFSPGRVDPTNTAWNASRKPLAGEFMYHGQKFFLITNHFNSKGGDEPLFGRFQPPTRSTEVQRHQQAQIVNNFVDAILAADSNANVVVLGDLNDFEFSQTVSILEGGVLHALMKTLPQNERYSYVFEGNSQSLDHIVVSDHVFGNPFTYDAVHVNAEFFDQLSDHDPQVARFVVNVNAAPSADAGDGYTVAEGGTVSLSASGNDPEGGPLTYAWDLDNNGSFETSGQTVTFSAAALDGPSSHTVHVQVTDNGGLTATDIATVNVTNVAPQATFSAPVSAFAGFAFTISLTNATDPSAEDTAAGFTYAFDCGDGAGYGDFGTSSSTSCTALDVGAVTVRGKIRDKDNGERPYTATVQVTVTYASLCALVRSYTSDQALADQLCQRLEQAQSARSANAKESHLERFRDRVDKSGAFTPTQAATLKRLSTRL
jgi:predicted extracellular nuclease